MGYHRLNNTERATIMLMRRDGHAASGIARKLGRSASMLATVDGNPGPAHSDPIWLFASVNLSAPPGAHNLNVGKKQL
ncbi:MAG TPA: helix-turn-helix domain-containing protein [Rhizomicrobium sp.]|nr:helix-turn-helix domain-containing protein [Rhizomicrobium sp.]